jgi:hypothetical protein
MPGFAGGDDRASIYYWLLARIWTVGRSSSPSKRSRRRRTSLRRGTLLAANLLAVLALVLIEVALPSARALFFVEGRASRA